MFYQTMHSEDSEIFTIEYGTDFSFPPHLHGAFELITVTDGEMEVSIENKTYTLSGGDAVFVFPDQVHSLSTTEKSRHVLWIFSSQYIKHFFATHRNLKAENNMFHPSADLFRIMMSTKSDDSIFTIKGILYLLIAEFDKDRKYISRIAEKKELLLKIFDFVGENYSRDCQLKNLSDTLGYSYVYLSRYFKERTGISFTAYVNRYRINESCYLLLNKNADITTIAFECGFDSVRSFNRNFKEYMHKSPHEYRDMQ
ncbi:MAG: AraC family transcriptional regulator [Clostridia bacterium]|nr:AraC family transcriptional regulator [Clostridia bacterium]